MYICNAKLTNLWETAVSLYCFFALPVNSRRSAMGRMPPPLRSGDPPPHGRELLPHHSPKIALLSGKWGSSVEFLLCLLYIFVRDAAEVGFISRMVSKLAQRSFSGSSMKSRTKESIPSKSSSISMTTQVSKSNFCFIPQRLLLPFFISIIT